MVPYLHQILWIFEGVPLIKGNWPKIIKWKKKTQIIELLRFYFFKFVFLFRPRGEVVRAASCITLACMQKRWCFCSRSHICKEGRTDGVLWLRAGAKTREPASGVFAWRISPLRRPCGRSPTGITARVHFSNITHPQVTTFYVIKLSAAVGGGRLWQNSLQPDGKIFPSLRRRGRWKSPLELSEGEKGPRALALLRRAQKIELKSRGS